MKRRAVFAIATRDIKSTLRDKMALFWMIAFPVLMLMMSFYIWVNPRPPVVVKVGVVYADSTINDYPLNATTIVYAMNQCVVNGTHVFAVSVYEDKADALNDLKSGSLDAVMVFPEKFSENLTTCLTARLELYVLGGDAYREQVTKNLLLGFLSEFSEQISIQRLEYVPPEYREYAKGMSTPINATCETVKPKALADVPGLRGWYTVGMMGIEFIFIGLISGALAVVEEKEHKTLERLVATPMGPWDLLVGKTLSTLFWLAVSALVCVGTGLAFGAKISWDPLNPAHWGIPLLLVLGGLFMIGLGLIISVAGKTSKGAEGLAFGLGWPLMFLTGIWIPKWLLPSPLRMFADYFPLTWAIDACREVLIFEKGLDIIASAAIPLAATTVVVYIIGAFAYKLTLRRFIEKA